MDPFEAMVDSIILNSVSSSLLSEQSMILSATAYDPASTASLLAESIASGTAILITEIVGESESLRDIQKGIVEPTPAIIPSEEKDSQTNLDLDDKNKNKKDGQSRNNKENKHLKFESLKNATVATRAAEKAVDNGANTITPYPNVNTITNNINQTDSNSINGQNKLSDASSKNSTNGKPVSQDSSYFNIFRRLYQAISLAVYEHTEGSGAQSYSLNPFITYLVSPFSMLCIFMALVMNRTSAFASTRRPVPLPLHQRLMLRSLPIFLLSKRALTFLTTFSCRHEWVYRILPEILRAKDRSDCINDSMLWDLFWTICLGQFIEAFSSVIQGHSIYSEAGMSLFEYSMAFQEIQSEKYAGMYSDEVRTFCLVCSLMLLMTHISGAFNLQQYRLIPSTFFSLILLGYFSYSIYRGTVLNFPLFFIISYVPQLVSCVAVVICAAIYGLACLLVGGPRHLSISLKNVHISMREDFYSCVVKLSVVALTAASKATYLNESAALSTPLLTWVDKKNAISAAVKSADGEEVVGTGRGENSRPGSSHKQSNANYIYDEPFLAPSVLKIDTQGNLVENADAIAKLNRNAKDNCNSYQYNKHYKSPYGKEVPVPKNVMNPPNQFGRTNDDALIRKQYGVRSMLRLRIAISTLVSVVWLIAFSVYNLMVHKTGLYKVGKYFLEKAQKVFGKKNKKSNKKKGTKGRHGKRKSGEGLFDDDAKEREEEEEEEEEQEDEEDENDFLPHNGVLETAVADWFYKGLNEETDNEGHDTTTTSTRKKNSHASGPKGYANLLWGRLIPEIDSSKDYNPDDAEDDDFSSDEMELEYNSDYTSDEEGALRRTIRGRHGTSGVEDYAGMVASKRQAPESGAEQTSAMVEKKPKSTMHDLYDLLIPSTDEFLALLDPQNSEQIERRRILLSHLQDLAEENDQDGDYEDKEQTRKGNSIETTRLVPAMTRSQFQNIKWDETRALSQVISERRRRTPKILRSNRKNSTGDKHNDDDDEDEGQGETMCVVCQCQARQIVLWPCRCLTVCDDCRSTLAVQSFEGCVCCRRPVVAFSKIYVP